MTATIGTRKDKLSYLSRWITSALIAAAIIMHATLLWPSALTGLSFFFTRGRRRIIRKRDATKARCRINRDPAVCLSLWILISVYVFHSNIDVIGINKARVLIILRRKLCARECINIMDVRHQSCF